ncbi:MAG: glutaredoxin family protein [Candidatus Saccharimonadales bacterium]
MMNKQAPKVTVYSAVWCAYCHMAMEYLKSKGVDYNEVDIDKEPAAVKQIVAKTGQVGVPVIEIGDKVILGFNRPAIDEALKAN